MNARLILTGLIAATATVRAQIPILFYNFTPDPLAPTAVQNLGADLTDGILVGAATIAQGGPATGFSGGPTGSILALNGDQNSFVNSQLSAGTLGFTTDNYTSSAWVRLDSFGGDSMVFGQRENTGSDTYLHNGVRNDNPHMGHWGNDTTGSTNLNTTIGAGNWFHLTFRYSGDEQSIYVNGNLVARENRGNLPSLSNVLIGSSNNDGGLSGGLDDVAVYNSSLSGNQIAFLANGGDPTALPAPTTISNAGYLGAPGSISPTTINTTIGQWAVREVASPLPPPDDGPIPDNLLQAVDVLKNPPSGFIVADGSTATVNRRDPQSGASHLFIGDAPFLTDTGVDDNRRAFLYRSVLRVTTEGDYTFGYHGDDGFALRIGNHEWTSTSPGAGGLGRIDADDRRTLLYPVGTGDADMRGVIHLTPGDHPIELVSWEGVGGGSHELYYAHGVFSNDSDTAGWRLVGTNSADNALNVPRVTGGWNVTTSNPLAAPGDGTMNTVAAARAALTATGTTINGVSSINYNDPGFGGPGVIGGDVPFPKDTAGVDDDDYAILARGILHIDVADTYRIGFEGDDGGYLRISGVGANPGTADDWTIVENATGLAYVADLNGAATSDGDTLWADVLTGNSRTVGDVFLTPGDYDIESLFFERGGGSYFEIYVTEPDTGTALQLLSSTSQTVDLATGSLQIVPEPTSIAMMLGGFGALLGFQRVRRRH